MKYNEWITAFTKITGKLNKKSPLSTAEIDELLEIIEQIQCFIKIAELEVMKRQ